jgi:hypothetical protein
MKAPVLGGISPKEFTGESKERDRAARLQIAIELGHARIDIANIYLGK